MHSRTRQTVTLQSPALSPNQTEVKAAAGLFACIKMMALAAGSNGVLWSSVSIGAKKMEAPVDTVMPQQLG